MKKIYYIILASLVLVAFNKIEAQDAALDFKVMGSNMCNCINSLVEGLHPQVKQLIIDADKMGMEDAQNKLQEYLTAHLDEVQSVLESADRMADFDNSIKTIPNCKEMVALTNSDKTMSEEFETDLINYLKTNTSCEFAYLFYKLGTSE